ncbi:MAG TPA: histidine kinase [Oxalicibacterium sp.]|uniref:PAS domain-containing sensor histidine kinase n=1 Tax=Oxalicibacterium sp. TaxID=2766525 RepID=UPI002BA2C3E2|nr:histidine kinase [Oxalicibacterium sp.]HWU98476.1 histidine kinase [Oxalicibacterium sp.]
MLQSEENSHLPWHRLDRGDQHPEEIIIDGIQAEWLPIILQGSLSEIYVFNCDTLHFEYANQAATDNLQYNLQELGSMSPASIVRGLTPEAYAQLLDGLRHGSPAAIQANLTHARKDGSTYPIEFRLFYLKTSTGPVIIAIGNDVSSRDKSDKALRASESRLGAMVSNTPGLVYQFLLHGNGRSSFPYLSEGCEALLGVTADELHDNPSLFMELILPEDRPSYMESMAASTKEMSGWNWEGRIRIEKWNDIKWINLRATPRALDGHDVQWEGIMTNITASKLEQEEIIRSRAQLAELSAHIDTVKEQERTRIAREIHDDLGGNLTAIKMALTLLARRLPKDPSLIEKADYVEQLVDRTIETVHRIASDLRPGVLDFGLVAAIDWQAKEFEKQCGIPCEFSANKTEIDLDPNQAAALFRIFQEALTNIAKHAHASLVHVQLLHTHRYVRLEIVDNGRGIKAADRAKPKSFGIRGMVERSIAMGGSLSVSTSLKGGTIVAINVPLPDLPELSIP